MCHRGRGQPPQQEVALTESCQFWFEAAIIPEVRDGAAGGGGCRASRPPALILNRHCLGTQAERETAERAAQLCFPGICFPISRLRSSTKVHLCTCAPLPVPLLVSCDVPIQLFKGMQMAEGGAGCRLPNELADGSLGRSRLPPPPKKIDPRNGANPPGHVCWEKTKELLTVLGMEVGNKLLVAVRNLSWKQRRRNGN